MILSYSPFVIYIGIWRSINTIAMHVHHIEMANEDMFTMLSHMKRIPGRIGCSLSKRASEWKINWLWFACMHKLCVCVCNQWILCNTKLLLSSWISNRIYVNRMRSKMHHRKVGWALRIFVLLLSSLLITMVGKCTLCHCVCVWMQYYACLYCSRQRNNGIGSWLFLKGVDMEGLNVML